MEKYSTEIEVWKDIEGYEGIYQVSNLGRVRSLDRHVRFKRSLKFFEGKMLSLWKNNKGYERVTRCANGKCTHFLVSRLVAQSFLPKIDGKDEVNHIDYNPLNNVVSNLEWCTKEENYDHSRDNIMTALTEARRKPVIGTNVLNGDKIELESAKQGKEYGFDPSAITNCLKGNYKQTKGYTWKYK